MASESPTNDPGTPSAKHPTATPPTPPTPPKPHPPPDINGEAPSNQPPPQGPQGQPFAFFPGQDGAPNGDPPHDATPTEPGAGITDYSTGLFPFSSFPPLPHIPRPKRTQCKNACTNCQKACKKCDDNRPCHRCIRYGTTDTCVDSKRKERKKGVKRGPYKKRDSKGHHADAENDNGSAVGSAAGSHGPSPNMPYVGPVGYPPGMWSSYPGNPGAKIEGGGYYQPVFALTPVGGQPPHGHTGDGENAGGGNEGAPHFPVGFYPATFISYPGPYPPYPMPHGQGSPPQGFHYAYPPPPGMYAPRPPLGSGNPNGEQGAGASGSSGEAQAKDTLDAGAAATDEDKNEDREAVPEPQVNGKAKAVVAETQANGTAAKEAD